MNTNGRFYIAATWGEENVIGADIVGILMPAKDAWIHSPGIAPDRFTPAWLTVLNTNAILVE